MELCTTTPQSISNLPNHDRKLLITNPTTNLSSKSSVLLRQTQLSCKSLRLHSRSVLYPLAFGLPRATTSEETPSGVNPYAGEERDNVISLEDVAPPEKNLYNPNWTEEAANEDSTVDSDDAQAQIFEFFNNLNIKLDNDDTYAILIYGGGALFTLWLASAVVGAIDSIPVFPKLLEVVGLGYTVWFSTRYLIFKKNREELVAKIQVLKQQVLGSDDD